MRVAFDGHVIGERETGNEAYALNLLRALAQQQTEDHLSVLTPHPDLLRRLVALPPSVEVVRVRPAASLLRIPFGMPSAVRRTHADLLHVSYVAPPRVPCATVVTVHDLSFEEYPQSLSPRARLILKTQVPRSVRHAARVIAVSDFSKRDLVARYRLDPERIRVVHEAAPPHFRPLERKTAAPLRPEVREPFVLAVGNTAPRKNLGRLLEAFAAIAADVDASLVLVGKANRLTTELVAARRIPGRITLTGYVGDDELVQLYNRAALFIYPSLYEGFGLPPLEAMACGCPVVASNVTAMPEVLADAALLVDPTSTPALAEAMRAVLTRDDLARDLRAKGLRQAARYSWERAATETRAVYAEAIHALRSGVQSR